MTANEYRKHVNPCWGCDCYDEDMGCTMSQWDRCYACLLEKEEDDYGEDGNTNHNA